MSDELRDRVARDDATYMAMKRKIMSLIVDTWDGERLIDNAADAAIALARDATLEEAAKVAVTPCPVVPHPRECERCANTNLRYGSPRAAAAAIRAMKGKP